MTDPAEIVREIERSGYAVIPNRMDRADLAAARLQDPAAAGQLGLEGAQLVIPKLVAYSGKYRHRSTP